MEFVVDHMYIFDLDDTLFNTHHFKQMRYESLARFGISKEQYFETSERARKLDNGLFGYTNERHAQALAELDFDKDAILAALQATSTIEILRTFLNDGAIECLEEIKKIGRPMILLSLGDSGFQELKTIGSGVHTYFDRTFMVNDTKLHVLQELFSKYSPKDAWFINDKIDETRELTEHFPEMKIALKKSERFLEEAYKKSGFPYFFTLKEIAAYVTT